MLSCERQEKCVGATVLRARFLRPPFSATCLVGKSNKELGSSNMDPFEGIRLLPAWLIYQLVGLCRAIGTDCCFDAAGEMTTALSRVEEYTQENVCNLYRRPGSEPYELRINWVQ